MVFAEHNLYSLLCGLKIRNMILVSFYIWHIFNAVYNTCSNFSELTVLFSRWTLVRALHFEGNDVTFMSPTDWLRNIIGPYRLHKYAMGLAFNTMDGPTVPRTAAMDTLRACVWDRGRRC